MTPLERRSIIRKVLPILRQSRTFFLSGHAQPDADTVGSEIAVASLLKRLGKKVDIYNAFPVPKSLHFLKGVKQIRTAKKITKKYDCAIIFECADAARMGNIIDFTTQAKKIINIDHHMKYGNFGTVNWVNVSASSNSEQLVYLFEALKVKILPQEAAALYAGMLYDTGGLRFSSTSVATLESAKKLVAAGADVAFLNEKILHTRSRSALRLLSRALQKIEWFAQGRLAITTVTQEDFSITQTDEEDTEEFVNFPLQAPDTLMSLLLREPCQGSGPIKVSLRSRRGVDVCALASQFGGGGHKYASGCKFKTSLSEAKKTLQEAALKILSK